MKGFYRGMVPPLIGATMYRSSQFASYEAVYTRWGHDETMMRQIPGLGGLEIRVPAGGVVAGTCRAIIECPFEYSKVRRQVGENYLLKDAYKGFSMVWLRSVILLVSFFSQIDTYKRHTNVMDSKLGQFWVAAQGSVVSWLLPWPF